MQVKTVRDSFDSWEDEGASNFNINVEENHSVLKQIVLLHTKFAWKNFIILLIVFLQFQLILYDISFRGRTAFPRDLNDFTHEKIIMDSIYAFDVFTAIIYKRWTNLSSTYGQPTRPIVSLVIDVISLLPLEWIYYIVTSDEKVRVFYLLSTNHLLRIHCVFSFFSATRNNVGERRVFIRIAEFLVLIFSLTAIAVAAMINAVDMVNLDLNWLMIIKERSSYPSNEFEWCIISYYVMLTQISSHGLPEVYPGIYSFVFIVVVLVSLWMIQAFEIAYLKDIILQRDYDRSLFDRAMHLIIAYLNDMSASKETQDKVKKYYNYFWQKQGSSEFKITKFKMYPSIFLKECALELAWDAIQHSHLFRDQPIPFLRNLAILFEREYYSPGEVIIYKYEWKNKFIYVVSGVVQLLSEEDNSSPILSFSGGTILCESTLILSHRSLCNVIACTEVELNVLQRYKFVELMLYRYQDIYEIIHSRIRFRYWKALRLYTIGAALQKNKSHIVTVPACTDIVWLKRTLSILQNRHNRISRKEKKDTQVDSVFANTDFGYTFAHLDMLVISDDIAIMTEQVCLNNGQIPCIFYPRSSILEYWEGFVLVSCLILTMIIPIHATQLDFNIIGLTFLLNTLSVVYFVDLIIISSTALNENDTVYTNILDIISRRMLHANYWTDVIAAFPIDWILILFGTRDEKLLAYCKINRLVKIYRVITFEEFFSTLENKTLIMSPYKLRVIKYIFYMTILTYFSSSCILLVTCQNGVCQPAGWFQKFIAESNDDMKGKIQFTAFLYASQILVGIGIDLVVPKLIAEYLVSIPLLIIGALAFNYVISSIVSCQILADFTKSWFRFYTLNIALILDLYKVTKSVQNRVFKIMQMEWIDNNAYFLTFKRNIFDTMTPKLIKELEIERFSSLIKEVEIFRDMEENCIKEICSICHVILFPPRGVVGYRGNECSGMYIIEKGHCHLWKNFDTTPTDVTRGKAFYVLEMCCNINNLHTLTTVTHASVVQIKLEKLMQVLSQFPLEKTMLMKTVKKFKSNKLFVKLLNMQSKLPRQNMTKEVEKNWQQIDELAKTKTNQKTSNIPSNNLVEERSWKQTIFMLFLLKSTISPDGNFIKIWEWIRSICAFSLIALYSAEAIISRLIPDIIQLVIILALNSMMIIDIYVRFHVQFYNSHKILVTHPLSTAKNYIRTGLIVDVLAIFPMEYFFISRSSHSMKTLWFCRLNRLLLTCRIIAALRYHYSWPYIAKYVNCVMFLPLIILTAHVFACGLLHEFCEIGDHIEKRENFVPGIYCDPENVVMKYEEKEPITPMKMYIYSLLYVFASITRIGVVNLRPKKYTTIVFVVLLTFMSFLLLMIVTTYTISTISRRDATLTAFQKEMTILMSYLKENKVSIEFREKVVDYFENFWILRRGTSIIKQMRSFPRALREDVFWSVYGPSLEKSPGLSKKDETFFRSLIGRMEVKFYSKGSDIMTVNLVHRFVYFIHWGLAEVIGPDGTQLAVLGCGSIFGNFTGSGTMRQTCSIVARTHVEAIVIDSMDFFDLMMRHPETKKNFLTAVALNTDYLKAEYQSEIIEVVNQSNKKYSPSYSKFILLPNSTKVQTWEIFSLLFSCYFGFGLSVYYVAVANFSIYSLILVYAIELAFIIKIVLVFFTAFEDDLGDCVLDKTQIARRFRRSKLGFYFHIFTIIPFEVLCIWITNVKIRWDVYPWLRLNRVPRLILVIDYLKTACNRLNINISGMRIFYAIILLISILHGAACLMIVVQKATTEDMPELEELGIYVDKFYTVSTIFMAISSRDFPKNSSDALYCIFLSIVFYVAHAILLGEVCAVVDVNQFIMNEYERKITFFQERVTRMNLTHVLKMRAWTYGSKLWKLRSGQQTPRLIREAPLYLQYAVSFEMYGHHVVQNKIFGDLHEDFIKQLTFHFKDSLFFPGDIIVNAGDVDETFYFVHEGAVDVQVSKLFVIEKESHLIQTLGPGQCFGLVQGLYERIPHSATYVAKTTAHIIYLYRPHWIYLLKYFPVTTVNLYKAATQIVHSNGLDIYAK